MAVTVNPVDGGFAREVAGLDLWSALDRAAVEAIRGAWSTCGVLVFRRQVLTEDELVAFGARFGEPVAIVRADWASQATPEVTYISNLKDAEGRPIGRPGSGEVAWHTDQSYRAHPATGTFLYAVEVPGDGGNTYFANLQLAYEALPRRIKDRIAGRRGIFSYARRVTGYEDEKPLPEEVRKETPDVMHPLTQVHPVTGRTSLYIDPSTVIGIEGLPADEGGALLDEINAHAVRPEFVYEHRWRVGDLVMWDNGFLMHRRDPYDPAQRRFLKRTSVALPPARHIVPG